jgi:protein-arginine kinase activator protein McsA
MECVECKKTEDIIVFKGEESDYFICEVCWNEKLEKGNKNHNSYIDGKKFFDPRNKWKQI